MKKLSSTKLPTLVIDAFFDAIEEGDIKMGEVLASERELSEQMDISRGTLREGLSILEFLGVIRSKGNRKLVEKDYSSIKLILDFANITEKNNIIHDYIEFRRFIELENVRLACENITEIDLKKMNSNINELSLMNDDSVSDFRLHMKIAKAGKNEFLIYFTDMLLNMVGDIRPNLINYPGRKPFIIEEWREIYAAIAERDVERAQKAMIVHLSFIEKTLKILDGINE